jgi:CheY-like chemotaxis protein
MVAQIFEPFFTTKEVGHGTGLGLATVYGAVKQNNGFLDVSSEPGAGSTFDIYLPLYQDEAVKSAQEQAAHPESSQGETLLLVEDDPVILEMCFIMLEKLDYRVLAAAGPHEALRRAAEHTGKIDLLLTDVIMPEMNGKELSHRLLAWYPALKLIYMSGYTADVIAHHGVLDEGVHFLQKPFSTLELSVKIKKVLKEEESTAPIDLLQRL